MHLFSPLEIRGVKFRNRYKSSIADVPILLRGRLCHGVAPGAPGQPGRRRRRTRNRRSDRCRTYAGRFHPPTWAFGRTHHIAPLARIAAFVRSQGAVPGIQLAHAGRKASTSQPWQNGGAAILPQDGGWVPVAPCAIPFHEHGIAPTELSTGEIANIVTAFGNAAKRALEAGFQVIEIHGAHGYLLDEFLSPLANHRTDAYGGVFDNRIRIVLEVIAAIRKVWPESLPLFLRISATDWVEGGWEIGDSVELASCRVKPLVWIWWIAPRGGMVPWAKISPDVRVPCAFRRTDPPRIGYPSPARSE